MSRIKERIVYAKTYKRQRFGEKIKYAKKVGIPVKTIQRWVRDLALYEKAHRRSRYLMKKRRNGKFFP